MKTDLNKEQVARPIYKRGMKKKVSFVSAPKVKGVIQTESALEAIAAFALSIDLE